jgi:hypothetical protein
MLLTLREERSLRVFEAKVLRKIFMPKEGKYQETGENCIMRSSLVCTAH